MFAGNNHLAKAVHRKLSNATFREGNTMMKFLLTIGFCVIANFAFALTETIDGITWNYYVSEGAAILEYPNIRENEACPKPVHEGVLPPTLRIPSTLGGYEVREIGIAAFQIPADSDVQKLLFQRQ